MTNLVLPGGPHPVATFSDILMPRPRAASQSLMTSAGLELTYNARGALLQACREIAARGRRQILLPAYHCPSGITPALHAGLEPVFYRIRRDLSIDVDDLLAKSGPDTAAVLVIHFFGIATDLQPLQVLRERGIELIEDWSHSFLQGTPPRLAGNDSSGDYRVFSFWKLAPSVIGGGLWRAAPKRANDNALRKPPLREAAVRLKRMLEEALNQSDFERAKTLFSRLEAWRVGRLSEKVDFGNDTPSTDSRPGESHYPFDPVLANSRMPGLARRILESCDFEALMQARRANFLLYSHQLKFTPRLQPVYPQLPNDACPWVYPVFLQNRDAIDHHWRAAGVALHTFGIYLHSALCDLADATTIADARYLAEHLLCLSIHQGLGGDQIARSADLINRCPSGL
jgi:dTDP-4-amino-4,6-dideoxygalactose transaminase